MRAPAWARDHCVVGEEAEINTYLYCGGSAWCGCNGGELEPS